MGTRRREAPTLVISVAMKAKLKAEAASNALEKAEVRKQCPPLRLPEAILSAADPVFMRALWNMLGPAESIYEQHLVLCEMFGVQPMHLYILLSKEAATWREILRRIPEAAGPPGGRAIDIDPIALRKTILSAASISVTYAHVPAAERRAKFILLNPGGTAAEYCTALDAMARDLRTAFREYQAAFPTCLDNEKLLEQWILSQPADLREFYTAVRESNGLGESVDSRGVQPMYDFLAHLEELTSLNRVALVETSRRPGRVVDPRYSSWLRMDQLLLVMQTRTVAITESRQPQSMAIAAVAVVSTTATAGGGGSRPPRPPAGRYVECYSCHQLGHYADQCTGQPSRQHREHRPDRRMQQGLQVSGQDYRVERSPEGHVESQPQRATPQWSQYSGGTRVATAPPAAADFDALSLPVATGLRGQVTTGALSRPLEVQRMLAGIGPSQPREAPAMSLPARGPLCYTCYEHGHYQDSCPRNATQEAAVGHFRVSGTSAAVDLARQRRILVPIMAGPLLSQKPAVAFLDPGADTSCIGWDALMYVTGMTREQLIPHLDPAVFTSVRGVHEGDAPLASDGSLNIPIEVIYSRRDLSLGGVVGVVQGTQVLRMEVVGGCSHSQVASEPGQHVLLVGSNDLLGSPGSMLCQLMAEAHLPHVYELVLRPVPGVLTPALLSGPMMPMVSVEAGVVSGSGLSLPVSLHGESSLVDLFQHPREQRDPSSSLDTLSVPRSASSVAIGAAFTRLARRIVAADEGGQGVVMELEPAAELEPVSVAATPLFPNRSTGVLERRVGKVFERLCAVFGDDFYVASLERGIRNAPSIAHMGLSPFEIVFGVYGNLQDRSFDFSPDERSSVDLSILLSVHPQAVTSLQHWMLCDRIDRQYHRERAVGPSSNFDVGDSVMLLRPPSDKMTQSGIAPYVVVSADDSGAFYSVALLGPAGEPAGMATRVVAGQLHPFDMSRTTHEWRRLQWQEFDDDTCLIRSMTRHRKSRRPSADARDLEFEVIWITDRGDVTTWEPARHLSCAGSVDFKEYERQALLVSHVRAQVSRERSVQHDGE